MSGSKITTKDEDRLDNVHPGDILREDFLIGSDVPLSEVASGTGIEAALLQSVLDGTRAVDANIDLRLARYFGISEGFFLGLQMDFDLEEERRTHGDELARIVRRAA
ncbi:MAG: HigA family addiction module antidote protein [Novosphingobium sp.]|mgnify:CR=1 FL=1|nr:HigA family addiction module antidote protein [Novosphingobium sp.]